jgi:hypothetical protein
MASAWTIYLCVTKGNTRAFRLFEGRYAALAHCDDYFNEDTEDYDLPEEIDGLKVFGLDDDWVVGGELAWYNDEETIEFELKLRGHSRATQALSYCSRFLFTESGQYRIL